MEKPAYVQMLVKEASLAARLDHPNIVHVFDLGCVEGLYYIAMEYLSGRSLAQMLRRSHDMGQRLPLRVLLTMIATSCDGLQYAHDYVDEDGHPLGLLHRDISPSNIMLTFPGRVALLDFGVATAARGEYKTKSSSIKGKFHYLAPERVRGQTGDRRSDIYSLGVVLYQCLTLRWPFRALNEYELLRQIANETPPPVRHYAPWVSGRLEQIIMRAMANDPTLRHQHARELASDLRDYLRAIGAVVEPSELSDCLAKLFPEAPEAEARRRNAPKPIFVDDSDDGIEIVFHASDARELGECESSEASQSSESIGLDQPDPVVVAVGSPIVTEASNGELPIGERVPFGSRVGRTRPSRASAPPPPPPARAPAAVLPAHAPVPPLSAPPPIPPVPLPPLSASPPPIPTAGAATGEPLPIARPAAELASAAPTAEPTATAPASVTAAPAAPAAPEERDDRSAGAPASLDVDIFPEPTRTIAPAGGDVFAGYKGRREAEVDADEPAFFSSRTQVRDPGEWPWARTVSRPEGGWRDAAPERPQSEESVQEGRVVEQRVK